MSAGEQNVFFHLFLALKKLKVTVTIGLCDVMAPKVKLSELVINNFLRQRHKAKQLMPTNVRQFWLQRKPSLAIHPSTFYHDIDAFSIEMIREHNEPHLVLPSLRGKLK